MSTATIWVEIDDQAAQLLAAAPAKRRTQLGQLISYLVEQFAETTPDSLLALMDEMSRDARAKGMTQAELDSMLRNA